MVEKFKYGTSFQTKILSALLSDNVFIKKISDVINVKYFENNVIQNITSEILKFYIKYNTKPTVDSLKTIFLKDKYKDISHSAIQIIIDAQGFMDSPDLDFVKDDVITFCKHQEIKKAILQSVDLLNIGNFDTIEEIMNKSFKVGLEGSSGIDLKQDFEIVFEENNRNPIELPWVQLNNITEGGLGYGELGVIAAPPGIGKSWALVSIASNAIKKDKKVVFFTLELYEDYVAKRFYANLTNTKLNNLKYEKEQIKQYIQTLKGDLKIQYYPTKTVSINSLKGYIEKLHSENFKPDLIVIDYADLLKPVIINNNKRDDQLLGEIYADLRGMAGEYEIPLFTASQINRCLNINELVNTKKGIKKLKYLTLNDEILTHKGFKKINKIYPITIQPSYKIILSSGKNIICSANHKFPTNSLYNDEIIKLKSINDGLKKGMYLFSRENKSEITPILNQIENIEFIGDTPTIDIEVDDTHMFYCNDIYTHNSGFNKQIIESDSISGSFEKIMIADLVISVSRQLEDKLAGSSRWHVMKNRFGIDGITYPAINDLSIGRIELYEPETSKAKEVKNNTSITKNNYFKSKYTDFLNK